MTEYEVTVTARKIIDVEMKVRVGALSKALARQEVAQRIAYDQLAEDGFEAVDKPRFVDMAIESVKRID
jgi:hypothetical protein